MGESDTLQRLGSKTAFMEPAASDAALRVLHEKLVALGHVRGRAPTWTELSDVLQTHPIPADSEYMEAVAGRALGLHPQEGARARIAMLLDRVHVMLELPGGLAMIWSPRAALVETDRAIRGSKPDTGNPFAPLLVWAHEHGPYRTERVNDRPDPLFPTSIVMARDRDTSTGQLFQPQSRIGPASQPYIPGLGLDPNDEVLIRCLPLHLYSMGVGTAGGRGRSIPLRLFVNAILDVPRAAWALSAEGVQLPPMRLRELVPKVYGISGMKHYRAGKQGLSLIRAMSVLASDDALVPFWFDGGGGAMHVVYPEIRPLTGRLDDWIQFRVRVPPGSGAGAIIDRALLIQAGLHSDRAYRMALGLAFIWFDRGGRLRVRAGKRGPWVQTVQLSAYDRYASVDDAKLIQLAYPAGSESGRRRQLYDARDALGYLEKIGYARRTPGGGIMPGEHWAGWGNG